MKKNPKKQPPVHYPCGWSFRIIGRDKETMEQAIIAYMKDAEYLLTASNTSRAGKYVSLNLETVVADEDSRNQIYIDLKCLECVTLVI
jgi:putative lipoic acid-binding regulatory protein